MSAPAVGSSRPTARASAVARPRPNPTRLSPTDFAPSGRPAPRQKLPRARPSLPPGVLDRCSQSLGAQALTKLARALLTGRRKPGASLDRASVLTTGAAAIRGGSPACCGPSERGERLWRVAGPTAYRGLGTSLTTACKRGGRRRTLAGHAGWAASHSCGPRPQPATSGGRAAAAKGARSSRWADGGESKPGVLRAGPALRG